MPSPVNMASISAKTTSQDDLYTTPEKLPKVSATAIPTTKSHPSRRRNTTLWDTIVTWRNEIFAVLVMFAALVLMCVGLGFANNRDFAAWPKRLSPASMLSWLGTIFKTAQAIVFVSCIGQAKWLWFETFQKLSDLETLDSASRGVPGAIKLLWLLCRWCRTTYLSRHQGRSRSHWCPSRKSVVPFLGAVLTISTLAFGPVLQMTVDYWTCPLDLDDSSSFNYGIRQYDYQYASASDTPLQFQGAVYGALYNTSTDFAPMACRINATCIYQDMWTAGVCSRCVNSPSTTEMDVQVDCSTSDQASCSYTLFNGTSYNLTLSPDRYFLSNSSQASLARTMPDLGSSAILTQTVLANVSCSRFDQSCLLRDPNLYHNGTTAQQCSLYTCAKKIASFGQNSTVTTSKSLDVDLGNNIRSSLSDLREVVIEEIPLASANFSTFHAGIPATLLTPDQKHFLDALNLSRSAASSSGAWYEDKGYCMNNVAIPADQEAMWNGTGGICSSAHGVSRDFTKSLAAFLGSGVDSGAVNFNFDLVNGNWSGPPGANIWNVFWDDGLWSLERQATVFDSLAKALTVQMRIDDFEGATDPDGGTSSIYPVTAKPLYVFTDATCIKVRWGYLAYPAVSFLATAILLVLTIVMDSRSSLDMNWKSSNLAPMFHGGSADRAGRRDVANVTGMKRAADNVRMRLKKNDLGNLVLLTEDDGGDF